MKRIVHVIAAAILGLTLLAAASFAATPANAAGKHYVCVPCGLPCDGAVYDQPGTCPKCGMALVDQATAAAQTAAATAARTVGILVFDGVEIIDYTGPWEMFGAAGFKMFTVAQTKDPVTTAMGMTVVPKYTFADAPQPDILLIPGGGVRAAMASEPTLAWIRKAHPGTQLTMSVCNGAFILASTGLLDGLSATTTSGNIDRMRTQFPKVKVVEDQRFVDNGKIITAAGLTAGIDGALHVISRLEGHGTAQQVALGEEYDWRPNAPFARASLADRQIPNVNLDSLGTWNVVSTQGGTDRWELVARGTSTLSAAELVDFVGREVTGKGNWKTVPPAAGGSSPLTRDWSFNGRDGQPWNGTLMIEAVPGKSHEYTATLRVARAG